MQDRLSLYKLLRAPELATLIADSIFRGSADDIRDGFIHLSTEPQLNGTLEKHFSGASDVFALDCGLLRDSAELVWEPSRGGALFPHLYRALHIRDVAAIFPLPENTWPCTSV